MNRRSTEIKLFLEDEKTIEACLCYHGKPCAKFQVWYDATSEPVLEDINLHKWSCGKAITTKNNSQTYKVLADAVLRSPKFSQLFGSSRKCVDTLLTIALPSSFTVPTSSSSSTVCTTSLARCEQEIQTDGNPLVSCIQQPTGRESTEQAVAGCTSSSCAEPAFVAPTEQAVRQKAARDKIKEELKAKGMTDAEIKKTRPRKKFTQEDHADDCGEDFGPLNEEEYLLSLAHNVNNELSIHEFAFFEDIYLDDDLSDDEESETDDIFDDDLLRNYFWVSEMEACRVGDEDRYEPDGDPRRLADSRLTNFTSVTILHLNTNLARPELKGSLDIMEIFGGEAGTTRICIRKRLRTGKNFDLVTGYDLTDERAQEEVRSYIQKFRPMFIIMGPPCTAFGCWSTLNRYIYPESWETSRKIGEILAKFAAEVASIQLAANRHFLIENPRGNDIFGLSAFHSLWNTGKVVEVTFPQCALGLMIYGEPILKFTIFWVSSTIFAETFRHLRCTHKWHGELQGSGKTKLAQVWPYKMCAAIAQGMLNVMRARDAVSWIDGTLPIAIVGLYCVSGGLHRPMPIPWRRRRGLRPSSRRELSSTVQAARADC